MRDESTLPLPFADESPARDAEPAARQCTTCREVKTMDRFQVIRSGKREGHVQGRCRDCRSRVQREQRWAKGVRKHRYVFDGDTRACTCCKKSLPIDAFVIPSSGKRYPWCVDCRALKRKAKYAARADYWRAQERARYADEAIRARKLMVQKLWRERNRERTAATRREYERRKRLWAVNGWTCIADVKAWIKRDEQAFRDEENEMMAYSANWRMVAAFNFERDHGCE